jgi:hypothetical protein
MTLGMIKSLLTVDTLVKWRDRFDSMAYEAPFRAGSLAFLGAAFEAYRWLQTAVWQPTNGWWLVRLLVSSRWLESPDRMLGLHKIIAAVLDLPLFISAPLLAWLVIREFARWWADTCRVQLANAGYVERKADDYADAA